MTPLEAQGSANGSPPSQAIPDADAVAPSGGRGTSLFHILVWLVFYAAVVVSWGQRNSWPDDLLLCLVALPVNFLVAWLLYDECGFGLESDPDHGQQEQLIAALILALGVASGQRLFMALGLVALGVGWLRPSPRGIDWYEWLKVPLLFLTVLPFWHDLEGSPSRLVGLFSDRACNPVYRLFLGIETSQASLLFYFGLVALILLLRGRHFWRALPLLPLFVGSVTLLPRLIPAWSELPSAIRLWVPWVSGALLLAVLDRWTRRRARPAPAPPSSLATRWFEQRRYPPWIAIVVVGATQAPPFQPVRWSVYEATGLFGMGLLFLVLLSLRHRTPRGPIHSRSVALVASAVGLSLMGEFVTNDELRHLGLGIALVGLLSWHCFWPLRIVFLATVCSVVFLAIPSELPLRGLGPDRLLAIRAVGGLALLGLLAWTASRPLPLPGARGYDDEAWVPPKRFALILLVLVLMFQIAGAFWPDHELPPTRDWDPMAALAPSTPEDPPVQIEPDARAWTRGPAQIIVSPLRNNPGSLASPEQVYRRRGWTIRERRIVAHPRGEAFAMLAERAGTQACVLWWFEHGTRAFTNHRFACRILWSSWHLADRRLRLVRVESTTLRTLDDLVDLAGREHWFENAPFQNRPASAPTPATPP